MKNDIILHTCNSQKRHKILYNDGTHMYMCNAKIPSCFDGLFIFAPDDFIL